MVHTLLSLTWSYLISMRTLSYYVSLSYRWEGWPRFTPPDGRGQKNRTVRYVLDCVFHPPLLSSALGERTLVVISSLSLSRVRLFATPWTVAYQAPPSMGFSRQEYWSGLPFPSPGDLPDLGIQPGSPALQADALTSEPPPGIDPHSLSLQSATNL